MWKKRWINDVDFSERDGDYFKKNNNGNSRSTKIEDDDNHIYFYSGVDSEKAVELAKKLRRLDKDLITEGVERDFGPDFKIPIWLHIHSYGGDIFAGFGLCDVIKSLKSPTYAIVEGVCASSATLIALACDKTLITGNSNILIHQLSALAWGTYEEFKDELRLQEDLMNKLYKFYVEHTSVPEEEIKEMLKRDYWMNAEEAVEKGFANEVFV